MVAPLHRSALVALLGAVLLFPTPARGAEATPIDTARAQVAKAVTEWEASRSHQQKTQSRSEALGHRISALKRLHAKDPFAVNAELERLLRQSVDADTALRASNQAVEKSVAAVRKTVIETIALIDARVKDLAPRLKKGTLEGRQTAARTINDLIAVRTELKNLTGRLEQPSATPRAWSHYEVRIDPLDGPSELKEKADFVEDTRDKFRKKREELARALREAREERKLLQAGAEFQADTKLFDEEARSFRVTRQDDRSRPAAAGVLNTATDESAKSPAATGRSAADNDATAERSAPTPVADPAGPQASATGAPNGSLDGFQGGAAPPIAPPAPQQPAVTSQDTTGGATHFSSPAPAKTFDPTPIARAVDPSALLNLRVESLDLGAVDLATLESLMSDLDKLDSFLESREAEIKRRADELKADEARALGSH